MDRDKIHPYSGFRTGSHSDSETIDHTDYPRVDFGNDAVFCGPITKRELLMSVEIEEEIVRRRIAAKKAKAIERRNPVAEVTEEKENTDDELNRTFDILLPSDNVEHATEVLEPMKQPARCIDQRALNDVTQLHQNREETRLLDLSVQLSRTSVKPQNRKSNRYLLDETIMFNESKIGARLPTPLPEKISKSKNMVSTRKQLDIDSKENKADIIGSTPPRLVKLSDTFITDLIGDNVLNATIPEDTDYTSQIVEPANTPDIFKRKQNRIWKNSPGTKEMVKTRLVKGDSAAKASKLFFPKSPAVAVGTKLPVKTKTPRGPLLFSRSPAVTKTRTSALLKSPATTKASLSGSVRDYKPLFPKSPVAAYIHEGLKVQSMSKLRHSGCVTEVNATYSKSDQKVDKKCKIPVPMTGMARRKLTLED